MVGERVISWIFMVANRRYLMVHEPVNWLVHEWFFNGQWLIMFFFMLNAVVNWLVHEWVFNGQWHG